MHVSTAKALRFARSLVLPDHGRRVFFMHVPKTGGTTVTHYVSGQIGPERCCPVRQGGSSNTGHDIFENFDFISGHFDFALAIAARAKGFAAAVQLRDPVARLTSAYNFLRSYADIHPDFTEGSLSWQAQTLPMATFFAKVREEPNFDNLCVRMLAGHRVFDTGAVWHPVGEEDYEQAVENLCTFDLVGFTHRQEALVDAILKRLGAPPVRCIVPRNVTAQIGGTSSLVKAVPLVSSLDLPQSAEALVHYDKLLFAYARRRFER